MGLRGSCIYMGHFRPFNVQGNLVYFSQNWPVILKGVERNERNLGRVGWGGRLIVDHIGVIFDPVLLKVILGTFSTIFVE